MNVVGLTVVGFSASLKRTVIGPWRLASIAFSSGDRPTMLGRMMSTEGATTTITVSAYAPADATTRAVPTERAVATDPSIVFNAYVITLIVFGSFTMAALHAESTKFLHLGAILSSALLCLLITSFFSRYQFVHSVILWGGLAINCGFVVYDTQLIAEKRRRGDTDYIWHTVML